MPKAEAANQRRPVVAIGLDSADFTFAEPLMDEGKLPTLARLRKEGLYGRVEGDGTHRAETPWPVFLTGVWPEASGTWGAFRLRPGTYCVDFHEAGTPETFPPFYALGPDRRVAVFDVPKTQIHDGVEGLQVIAWGSHGPDAQPASRPPEFFAELERTWGPHPMDHRSDGDWWDSNFLRHIQSATSRGAECRARIVGELLRREPWDLFLTAFSEIHDAAHAFYFLSNPDHPLHGSAPNPLGHGDPVARTFSEVDAAIGRMLEAAPSGAIKFIYSLHGMDTNTDDLPNFFFLGEILYRLCFPGRRMLAPGDPSLPMPPPILRPRRNNWTSAIWCDREDPVAWRQWLRRNAPNMANGWINRWFGIDHPPGLASPTELQRTGDRAFWQPISWYQPLWPQMKAFALPGFTGQIRINLKGREPHGLVESDDYTATCDWLEREFLTLTNPRNGKPSVRRVIRTRSRGDEQDPGLPDGDLIIDWADQPADAIEGPSIGRIGPVPFRRTGSHRFRGFYCISGPGIGPGAGPSVDIVDLPPTILSLMGEPIPSRLVGQPILPVTA